MKKLIVSSVLLGFVVVSFCQRTTEKQALKKTDYLLKSKKQKKIGRALLGGGVLMFAVSAIIPKGELVHDGICVAGICDDKYKNDGIKSSVFITGAVLSLASIPFFIASGKNKKRAKASVFINMRKTPLVQKQLNRNQSYPTVGIRISL